MIDSNIASKLETTAGTDLVVFLPSIFYFSIFLLLLHRLRCCCGCCCRCCCCCCCCCCCWLLLLFQFYTEASWNTSAPASLSVFPFWLKKFFFLKLGFTGFRGKRIRHSIRVVEGHWCRHGSKPLNWIALYRVFLPSFSLFGFFFTTGLTFSLKLLERVWCSTESYRVLPRLGFTGYYLVFT